MNSDHLTIASRRAARSALRGLLLAGFAAAARRLQHHRADDTTGSIPNDYRQRHPIALKEGERTLELFIGDRPRRADRRRSAPRCSPSRRAGKREATGGVIIDVPAGTPNERAAQRHAARRSAVDPGAGRRAASTAIGIRPYQPADRQARDAAAQLSADDGARPARAGCGRTTSARPTTASTSRTGRTTTSAAPRSAISPPWSTNPADLVQPRGETPAYTARRTTVLDKYRKGESPATIYPDANKGKISDVGK